MKLLLGVSKLRSDVSLKRSLMFMLSSSRQVSAALVPGSTIQNGSDLNLAWTSLRKKVILSMTSSDGFQSVVTLRPRHKLSSLTGFGSDLE